MKRQPELKFTFHNPNTPEVTADFLVDLFIEVNKPKVERAIQAAANAAPVPKKSIQERLAENKKLVEETKRKTASKARPATQRDFSS